MRIYGIFVIGLLAGCVDEPEISGQQSFLDNCAVCHGLDGKGGGVAALSLSVTPPDLTQLSARNGGVFPRNFVMGTIDGFDRDSHFAPDMPAFGDGDMGDAVIVENEDGTGTPIPLELLALADYLEAIQE